MDSTSTGPLRPGTSCGCMKITVRILQYLKVRMSNLCLFSVDRRYVYVHGFFTISWA